MLDVNIFDSMKIGLASPDKIRQWSHGEVKKPETINYRTLKPERDGLFCERIFGPTRDWECHCGKYKRVRYKGTICDRCGVEVTRSKVRRERMGHIELAAPVSHIWYFKGIPSRMGLLLDMSPRSLERVLYFASYIVLDPGPTDLHKKDLLTEGQFRSYRDSFPRNSFSVAMGAEAIQALLRDIDLDALASELRNELNSSNGQKRIRAIRRLEVVEAFRKSGNKPEWMILSVIPVIPPELRPMVQLDGGRFATSDLNDLYRRVINRNNRLNRLLKLKAPDIIVRNEKRMLQEAVDSLIDNGRRGRPVTGPGNRPLKSLSDMLKGKQGRFRQNLLGKRVDYSGRSVIVVGPELKLHQCGLPKEMALELFKPFVMKKLSSDSNMTIKAAKKKVERATPEVWAVLEDVIKEHPVLLNRAPTLHRLGIQAFEPVLTEGRALKLHPLACTAYNADFDGDQMAIHLPLSAEAQAEARVLMLAANHILAPKDGKPIIVPTQDMVLGTYYLTRLREGAKGEGKYFTSLNEALLAYETETVALQAEIFVRLGWNSLPERVKKALAIDYLNRLPEGAKGEEKHFTSLDEALLAYENESVELQEEIFVKLSLDSLPEEVKEKLATESVIVKTSVGRLIFNEKLPLDLRYYHQEEGTWCLGEVMDKVELQEEIFVRLNLNSLPEKVKEELATESVIVKTSVGRLIFNEKLPLNLRYYHQEKGTWCLGEVMDKKTLGKLVAACYKEFGATVTAGVIDEVKRLGYHFACIAGMTVAISDCIVPPRKGAILAETGQKVKKVETYYNRGIITEKERYNKVIALWNEATDLVADAMLEHMDSFNPIYMMSDSGARGNKQQMRQLAGMRGLMADPSGKIIDLPITANFREGLSVSDYFISSHGARKGLADTALRTADSGYLTRRLVDVAQDVIVRSGDCDEREVSLIKARAHLAEDALDALEIMSEYLNGRVLANGIGSLEAGQTLDEDNLVTLAKEIIGTFPTMVLRNGRSIEKITLGNGSLSAFLQEYRGLRLAKGVGELSAGHALSDADLQWLLAQEELESFWVRNNNIRSITVRAIQEGKGVIEPLYDRILGRTLAEEIEGIGHVNDIITEEMAEKICAVREEVQIRSVLTCKAEQGVCRACYGVDLANRSEVEIGEAVGIIAAQSIGEPGTQLTMRTFHTGGVAGGDITQGLPRVEELFEARKPKNSAIIAEVSGWVSYGKSEKTDLLEVRITPQDEEKGREYVIPYGVVPRVKEGEYIEAGENITEGAKNPHDILRICGLQETQRYLVKEVQKVYKSQGVEINDKHIEVMVRQMLHKVKIEDSGSTEFLPGEFVDINVFEAANTKAIEEDGIPAVAKPILLGISKASLATDSFLSAASFQETTRVLTDAAIKGKIDPLIGLKENVIIGKLIPAGTGMARYRELTVVDKETQA